MRCMDDDNAQRRTQSHTGGEGTREKHTGEHRSESRRRGHSRREEEEWGLTHQVARLIMLPQNKRSPQCWNTEGLSGKLSSRRADHLLR